jgi:hypothetical protein
LKAKYEIVYEIVYAGRLGARATKTWNVLGEISRERRGLSGEPISEVEKFPLGRVYWWSHWRRYIFEPRGVFDETCLRQIADFLETQTKEHRERRRRERAGA